MAFKMKKPSMTQGTAAHKSAMKHIKSGGGDHNRMNHWDPKTESFSRKGHSERKQEEPVKTVPQKEVNQADYDRKLNQLLSKPGLTQEEVNRWKKKNPAPTKKRDKVARLEEKKARSQARTEIKKAKVKRKRTKQGYGKGTDFIASKQKVKDLKVDEKIRRAKVKTKPKPGVTEGATEAMTEAAISKVKKKPSPVKKEGLKALYPNPPKKGAKDLLMPRAKTVTLVHKSKRSAAGKEFDKAFAAARKAGKKTFTWKGKSYNTKLA